MKKLPIAGIVSLLAIASMAATFNLTWDASPTPNVYYRVFSSTNGASWKLELVTTNTAIVISNVPQNVVFFGVAATNNNGSGSLMATGEAIFKVTNLKIVEQ